MKNRIGKESHPNGWVMEAKKSNVCEDTLRDYCSHATLHGVQYIGARNTTIPEKIWWLIIVLASLFYGLYFISETWIHWKNNPVVLNYEQERRDIWDIPFPAVTVCPANKVRHTYYNYSYYFLQKYNLTKEKYKKFSDISLVCAVRFKKEFKCSINITDEEAITNIIDVAPKLNDTIFSSMWQRKFDHSLFEVQYNKEGVCFTFNSLSQDDLYTKEIDYNSLSLKHKIQTSQWTLEDGYKNYMDMDAYPRRTSLDGSQFGLRLNLVTHMSDIDYVCGVPIDGFKIILHNPVETTKATRQFLVIGPARQATIMVKPELITTSKELKSMSPDKRGCYFSNEKSLRFFKIYTENNCRLECKANITEKYCGCMPFYMPRDENSKICGFGKMSCLEEIQRKLLLYHLLNRRPDPSNKETYTEEFKIFSKCDCIAACVDLQFTAEVSHTTMHIEQTLKSSSLWNLVEPKIKKEILEGTFQVSQVEIFFKESQFLALTRSAMYGMNDFVADCGGVLGLFVGFSLLSVVEIFYFLTLRLWCKIRKMKDKK